MTSTTKPELKGTDGIGRMNSLDGHCRWHAAAGAWWKRL